MEVARCAAKLHRSGVIAFGMGGDELAFPAANFRPAFDLARSEGLRIVCHAGEIGGPESVREAVEILGAERIGHGIAVMHDPALAESLAHAAQWCSKIAHEQPLHGRARKADRKAGRVARGPSASRNFIAARLARDALDRRSRPCFTRIC